MSNKTMLIKTAEVKQFAVWSGDCNPIHVDDVRAKNSAFGGVIVHGALSSIRALGCAAEQPASPIKNLDIEFRGEIRPDTEYEVVTQLACSEEVANQLAGDTRRSSTIRVRKHAASVQDRETASDLMVIEAQAVGADEAASELLSRDWNWAARLPESVIYSDARSELPIDWSPEAFVKGQVIFGKHRFGALVQSEATWLNPTQEKVLGLSSFIVGMKYPGLSSLFTHLQVSFGRAAFQDVDHEVFAYRLTLLNYDPHFRILEAELEIVGSGGEPLAVATLSSYVRFPQAGPNPDFYENVCNFSGKLTGKTVLICGAGRGLGAELAMACGCAGAHVYLACRTPTEATQKLVSQIVDAGGSAQILIGDVGNQRWCDETWQLLSQRHGRLDLLILNACAPPIYEKLVGRSFTPSSDYVGTNVQLFKAPLKCFMDLVQSSSGIVVGISSSFVTETPAGFSDYVAVKMALEASIRIAAREAPQAKFIIARPPRLQTSWNDTPSGALGAIPAAVVAATIIESTLATTASNLQLVEEFDATAFEAKSKTVDSSTTLAISATFTLDPFASAFELCSKKMQVSVRPDMTPYAQVLQQCFDSNSQLNKNRSGAVIYLRVSDWLRELLHGDVDKTLDYCAHLNATADEYIQALGLHRNLAAGHTLVILCPSTPVEIVAPDFITRVENKLASELADVPGLTFWKAEDFHERYAVPAGTIWDDMREEIAHIPYQDAYYTYLATLTVRFFCIQLATPKKVVCLDCDNTLWRGVVGEVGVGGIAFEPAHMRLHKRLCDLTDVGMLLCLCSKNEESDVQAVFEHRADFGLRRDQIVAWKVNWSPKSQNLIELAQLLNLGLDSFIFLDDNPVECSEVRANCPEVLTIQWPNDGALADILLDHLWEFDIRKATKEDKQRTKLYREEFERKNARSQAANYQQFIDSLQLQVDISPLTSTELARASQLTMRTNQFNLTTLRRSDAELNALLGDSRYHCRTVNVRDRFGDYGLVGVIIAHSAERALEVDTFLLSCRVLGRGVEHRMAAYVGQLAEDCNLGEVKWKFIPTERNTPARMFLEQLPTSGTREDAQGASLRSSTTIAMRDFRFQVIEQGEEENTAEAPTTTRSATAKDRLTRARESQIGLILDSFNRYADMQEISATHGGTQAVVDVEQVVLAAFAKALKMSEDVIRSADRLDALGVSSLKIVEITVALARVYDWLPKTLLFEHRSISDIANAIRGMVSAHATKVEVVPLEKPSVTTQDIAIVGIEVHSAAGDSIQDLWKVLKEGRSAVVQVPRTRNSFVGTLADDRAYFAGLIDNAAEFDCEFFGLAPREAEYMDPQLRLLLENSWHALEDAGCSDGIDDLTGVFVGVMYGDYAKFANSIAVDNGSLYRCWEGFSLANRLSQVLGAHGPSLSIDTACSSSATALHYACRSLNQADCTMAIVCGVNLIVDPGRLVQLGRLGILSASGVCVPFGKGADGTVLGEGAVSLVLRPLSKAIERQDRIYAVIKGSGVSSGAGSVGFTAPNPHAQSIAASRALQVAGVDPDTISYIETHGTGTELGDPIEVRGLQLAYEGNSHAGSTRRAKCKIGSIKPNVGHLEAGAGLLGVAKTALQLHHATLVPSLSSDEPNPHIDFERTRFSVQRELTAWQSPQTLDQRGLSVPRRAAVNSFGVGGSNVHIVLEEADRPPQLPIAKVERSAHLLTVSAPSFVALDSQIERWKQFLTDCTADQLGSACFSQNVGRKVHSHRAAILCHPQTDGGSQLREIARTSAERVEFESNFGQSPKIAFLFTGQGAQYPQMARQLWSESPVFRRAWDEAAKQIDQFLDVPINDVVFASTQDDLQHVIHQTGYTQPAIFAIQYSLFQLWKSWRVQPDYLLGHSIGEIAAYCVAGGCSLADAARLVTTRGRLMQDLPTGGGMFAVEAPLNALAELLADKPKVTVAAINGPHQTVISGPLDALESVIQLVTARGIKAVKLNVSHAFHSQLMDPMLAAFEATLNELDLKPPQMTIVSSCTGQVIDDEMATPRYWLEQARNAVRFLPAMQTLDTLGSTHCIEIGPHTTMLGMGRNCLPTATMRWLPSLRRGGADLTIIFESVGKLFVDEVPIDWKAFDQPYERRRISVPGYQFQKRRLWIDELDHWNNPSQTGERHIELLESKWLSKVEWVETSVTAAESSANGTWVLVSTDATSLADMQRVVQRQGIESRAILLDFVGSGLTRDAQQSIVSCRGRDELQKIISQLGVIHRIVWIATAEADESAVVPQTIEHTSAFVEFLQVTGKFELAARSIWLVNDRTRHASNAVLLSLAPLYGVSRVTALENPITWGGCIGVETAERDLSQAVAIIASTPLDDQYEVRDGRILVPRMQPISRLKTVRKLDWRQGTVLITGGLGALGLRMARWCADQGVPHLVLVGRSDPTPDSLKVIEDLRSAGVQIDVVQADISQPDGVQCTLDALGSNKLLGVVHTAGVDHIGSLAGASREEIERLYSAKVGGAWHLHLATMALKPEFFLTFSSIASVWGSAGRGLYAAANSFLDQLAHVQRALGLAGYTVNFGPWQGGGMADQTALKAYEAIGNFGLEPDKALLLVGRLLNGAEPQVVMANIDWQLFGPAISSKRRQPIFERLFGQLVAGAPVQSSWRSQVASASSPTSMLEDLISAQVRRILGMSTDQTLPTNRNLFQLGMDSLTWSELMAILYKNAGVQSHALVTAHPTISELVRRLSAFLELPLEGTLEQNSRSKDQQPVASAPTIVTYQPTWHTRLIEFCKTAWPKRDASLIDQRWRWMFLKSAERLGLEPKVWLGINDDQVIGHHGAQFIHFKLGDKVHPTAWLVETMVLEQWRNKGIGPGLLLQSKEDLPLSLSLGQTEEMREILERLGWKRVAPLQTYMLPLIASEVLRGKLPRLVAPLASTAMQVRAGAMKLRRMKTAKPSRVEQVVRFDQQQDKLWLAASRSYRCATVRDSSYMNWKYVEQPGQNFQRLHVYLGSDLVGCLVMSIVQADAAYRYRRAYIVEFVASGEQSHLEATVQAALDFARQQRCAAIFMHVISSAIETALESFGFIKREPTRHLLACPGDNSNMQDLLEPEHWLVTQGDSDIDRPW